MKASYNAEMGKKQQLDQLYKQKHDEAGKIGQEVNAKENAKFLLTKTAEHAREIGRQRLEQIVTNALQYVFGPDFQFVIELKESRGRAEADFYVESIQGGQVVRTDPITARGGGVVDIIAIALQLAVVQIHHAPTIQGPIILDEPGKHVDSENAVKLAMFVDEMARTFGRQIIMVTHQPHLAEIAGTSYNVELKGGKSIATKRLQHSATGAHVPDAGSDGEVDGDPVGGEAALPVS